MKAYILTDKPGIASLTLVERLAPTPQAGQVLLRMKTASLNYRDLLVVKRTYAAGGAVVTPVIPLSDGVGEVIAVGSGVSRVQIGDRVASTFMPGWIAGAFTPEKAATALGGGTVNGVLAEQIVLDENAVVTVPEHLTDVEAATLPCAGVTAWYSLFVGANLTVGNTVLLLGTGGVSIFALQFAKAAGARVIITSSSDQKLTRAKDLGADVTINYRNFPDWENRVLEQTPGGHGADLAIEVGGAETLNKTLKAVRYGGHISLMGVLTGLESSVSTSDILHKNIRVQGVYVGSREMFEAMNRAISLHKIRPVVDRVFAFDDAPSALEYLEGGSHFGKVAVQIAT